MTERWIVIPKWDEFQHPDALRSSSIPWIKTWTRITSDDAYLGLTLARRGLLHGIWVEYARARGQLSGSTRAISGRLRQHITRQDLEALNDAGFIEFSASKPASTHASKVASPEKRREEEPPYPPLGNASKRHRPKHERVPFSPLPNAICPECDCASPYHHADCSHASPAATNGNYSPSRDEDRPPVDETLQPYDLEGATP